jgi:hypothetical protein
MQNMQKTMQSNMQISMQKIYAGKYVIYSKYAIQYVENYAEKNEEKYVK